jgi:cytoskeleton protein RodZ
MTDSEQNQVMLPGQRLAAGREALTLSQADVAASLNLSVSYIRSLEADDYKRLPSAAFIRGYIKNYAKLVGLPADELANQFQQIYKQAETQTKDAEPVLLPTKPAQQDRRLWWVAGAIGFVIALWLLWPTSMESRAPESAESEQMYSPPLESPAVDGEAVDANEGGLDADVPVPEPEVEAEAEIETVSVEPVADQLALSFQEACWLRVRDGNGEELYVGQRDAGQNLQLQGTGPFRITLGNAAAVSAITFNGAAVRVPQAEPGQVVTVRAQ